MTAFLKAGFVSLRHSLVETYVRTQSCMKMQQNTHGLVQLIRAATPNNPNQTPWPMNKYHNITSCSMCALYLPCTSLYDCCGALNVPFFCHPPYGPWDHVVPHVWSDKSNSATAQHEGEETWMCVPRVVRRGPPSQVPNPCSHSPRTECPVLAHIALGVLLPVVPPNGFALVHLGHRTRPKMHKKCVSFQFAHNFPRQKGKHGRVTVVD